MIHVQDFGAIPDGAIVNGVLVGTDCSAQIAAAILAGKGSTVQFEKGTYAPGPINATHSPGTILQGAGGAYGGTLLLPRSSIVGLDCSGSPAMQIRNLQVGDRLNPYIPKVGILHAPTLQVAGLDFVRHENVMVTGRYSVAAVYNFGAGTSIVSKCAYWNFMPAGGDRFAGVFALDNSLGAESPFTTLATSGPGGCWTFDNAEFHEYSDTGFGTLLLRGASDFVFTGGMISGSGELIHCKNPTGANPPRRILFLGVRFENEQGTQAPRAIFNLYSDVEDSHFWGCMKASTLPMKAGAGHLSGCTWNGAPL